LQDWKKLHSEAWPNHSMQHPHLPTQTSSTPRRVTPRLGAPEPTSNTSKPHTYPSHISLQHCSSTPKRATPRLRVNKPTPPHFPSPLPQRLGVQSNT
ncbi:hypothetical protein PIB30_065375, partial [Stylosanthes scabra]|nr:hypothetical protein [Stylosanthes scabra]